MIKQLSSPFRLFIRMDGVNQALCCIFFLCLAGAVVVGRQDPVVRASAAEPLPVEAYSSIEPIVHVKTVSPWQMARRSPMQESASDLADILSEASGLAPSKMNPSDLSRAATLLMKQGRYDEAATYFEALITNHRDHASVRRAWDPLARCYKELGNKKAERATYERMRDSSKVGSSMRRDALERLASGAAL